MTRIGSPWHYVAVVMCALGTSPAYAQLTTQADLRLVSQTSLPLLVELHGIVNDERGQPLSGAVVSALGATTAFAVSDQEGRFVLRNLSPGPYLVRAHLRGYVLARGKLSQVTASSRTLSTITLTKQPSSDDPPSVLTAGVGAQDVVTAPPSAEADESGHEHGEVAWRLRHLKRSVLKDIDSAIVAVDDEDSLIGESLGGLSRAVGGSARLATALFADLSLNGQVNLFTTTTFDRPQDLFSTTGGLPRGVAYVSLTTPGPNGEWRMKGTVTEGDLSSWIVAGSFVRRSPAPHAYEAGFSYGMQRYLGGNAEALVAMRDGSRNVGAIFAYDNWEVAPRVHIGYGAKYARYDYLGDRGLWSPRASITVQPLERDTFTLRAIVSRRETAPGAEEFLPPSVGLWLPPERTFSPIGRGGFRPERLDHVEVGAERQVAGGIQVGVRVFREQAEDQVVTLFGAGSVDSIQSTGHYHVGSAGDFEASGWGVSVSRTVTDAVRASIDYTQVDAEWLRHSVDAELLTRFAGSVLRGDERIHDLTGSVESVVTPTSTRVLVLYKVNTSFAATSADATAPVGGARFDVQVNQALPFLKFTNASWEALVAVTNVFRDDLADGSVYDELLVVRPPKRVLGGVTVRF